MHFKKRIAVALLVAGGVSQTAFADDETERLAEISAYFTSANLLKPITVVDCTLSGGTTTRCASITTNAEPGAREMGPWCPDSIEDGADKGGIWLESGRKYDVSGQFVKQLAEFYEDPDWQLYDTQTGKVHVTDTEEACRAAARPDVDVKYQNYCVECSPSYLGEDHSTTFVIPLEPVEAKKSLWFLDLFDRRRPPGFGVAFDGVKLEAPAPVDAILDAHTLAPFDDCGGHVNPHEGYHYHAVTGCTPEIAAAEEHAPMIGLALDGYGIFAQLNRDGSEPAGLDECRGHEEPGLGYHYHADAAGSNLIIGCLKAQHGCTLDDPDKSCDASVRPERP
ncbi:YHYH protein [Labrenzia sp. 011]|uniref:YHYH protein n=1 Tax=Labrenzia sp. 011 TaxID=2171494 RepID=UPI001402055D|nr:YHYH protein [Labrenzia sp. 011]